VVDVVEAALVNLTGAEPGDFHGMSVSSVILPWLIAHTQGVACNHKQGNWARPRL
jgi:hypothetical protein